MFCSSSHHVFVSIAVGLGLMVMLMVGCGSAKLCEPGEQRACYTGPTNTKGIGPCKEGNQRCDDDGRWGGCISEVLPSTEICDGKDNDCNGKVDDGLSAPPCSLVQGVCRGLRKSCKGTQGWADCTEQEYGKTYVAEEKEAHCDGLDNDCDGEIDEACSCKDGASRSCYTGADGTDGKGICRSGLQLCQGGKWEQSCRAQVLPGTEFCNGVDDDCDGETDEGLTRECYPAAPETAGKGPCKKGEETCKAGQWSACQGAVFPALESCNGKDDDCNGKIDDGLRPPLCTKQAGVCRGAMQTCDGAKGWKDCTATALQAYDPAYAEDEKPPACDGKDNDCDGKTDEGCTCLDGMAQTCYSGASGTENTGLCRGGIQVCKNNAWGACVGAVLPATEVCDGLDNDCDGKTDEDASGVTFSRDCYDGPDNTADVGLCKRGTQKCQNGAWTMCAGEVLPTKEVCDSKDNDCNGKVDDGFDLQSDPNNCGGCGKACQSNETCLQGLCQTPAVAGQPCTLSQPCATGHQCLVTGSQVSYCFKNCASDGDCPSPRKCVSVGSTTPVQICLELLAVGGDCSNFGVSQRYCTPKLSPPLYCSPNTSRCTEATYVDKGAACSKQNDTSDPQKICRPGQPIPLSCSETSGLCEELSQATTLAGCGGNTNTACGTADACVRLSSSDPNGYCLTKCDPNNVSTCPNGDCIGLQGGGGACLPYGRLAQDKLCKVEGSDPAKLDLNTSCVQNHLCISLRSGEPNGVCAQRVTACSSAACPGGQACLSLQSGAGVCIKKCTSNADCTETGTSCQSVAGNQVCAATPSVGPQDYTQICNDPITTKGCKQDLICLRAQQGADGYCTRDCSQSNTCPSAKNASGGDVTGSCVAVSTSGARLCVFDCSQPGSSCPVGLTCTTLQSGDKLCLAP